VIVRIIFGGKAKIHGMFPGHLGEAVGEKLGLLHLVVPHWGLVQI